MTKNEKELRAELEQEQAKLGEVQGRLNDVQSRIGDVHGRLNAKGEYKTTLHAEALAELGLGEAPSAKDKAREQLNGLYHEKRVLTEAVRLQRERVDQLRPRIVREMCDRLRPEYRKKVARLVAAVKELAAANDDANDFWGKSFSEFGETAATGYLPRLWIKGNAGYTMRGHEYGGWMPTFLADAKAI